ncbi:hypothetical protein ACS0TY_033268 [Phlomoides rotata]
MLLYGVLAHGATKESSEMDSHPNYKEEEVDSAPKMVDPRPTKAYTSGPGGNSPQRLGIPCETASEYGWGRSTARRPPPWPTTRPHSRCGDGCSPMIALKRKHSVRKKKSVKQNITKLNLRWRWRRTAAATAPPPVPTRLSFSRPVMNIL